MSRQQLQDEAGTVAEDPPESTASANVDVNAVLLAGLTSGVVIAGLFNPWDRALYLSVLHQRPFLRACNWRSPYTGFLQSLLGRTLSGGLYFPLYDLCLRPCQTITGLRSDSALLAFLAGNTAGAVNGIVLNHLTTVKYQSWKTKERFLRTAKTMFQQGGCRPFMKGVGATMCRDLVFGGVYSWLKYVLLQSTPALSAHQDDAMGRASTQRRVTASQEFLCASVAAGVGTIVSSPINWFRNIVYGSSAASPAPALLPSVRNLISDAQQSPNAVRHILQRFRIGWGTARVAVGMACGNQIYLVTKNSLEHTAAVEWE